MAMYSYGVAVTLSAIHPPEGKPSPMSIVLEQTKWYGMRLRVNIAGISQIRMQSARDFMVEQSYGDLSAAARKLGPVWWIWTETDGVPKPSWWTSGDDLVVSH